MTKKHGFPRRLKLEWLNKTVELIIEGKDESAIKNELDNYLGFEIDSKTNLVKTRGMLLNIWVNVPENALKIKEIAIEQYHAENSDKTLIHWCMILLAYPVFNDAAGLIGKIALMQDHFSTRWLKQKIFDLWGDKTTLEYSISRITNTMVELSVLERVKQGNYIICRKNIQKVNETVLIAMTIIALKSKAYYEVSEMSNVPAMFPFNYNISHQLLHESDAFSLNNFGGKVVVSGE